MSFSTRTCMCQSRLSLSRPQFVGRRALKSLNAPTSQRSKLLQSRHTSAQTRRVLHVSAAAAFELPSQQEVRKKAAARIKSAVPRPAQLPPPPKSTNLLHVLPYLTKLAVSDAQLYWRLGLAFALMIASKAAGTDNLFNISFDRHKAYATSVYSWTNIHSIQLELQAHHTRMQCQSLALSIGNKIMTHWCVKCVNGK